jgi:hypothetical protein
MHGTAVKKMRNKEKKKEKMSIHVCGHHNTRSDICSLQQQTSAIWFVAVSPRF